MSDVATLVGRILIVAITVKILATSLPIGGLLYVTTDLSLLPIAIISISLSTLLFFFRTHY